MTQIQPNYESGSPRRPSMTSDYNEDIFDEVIEEYSEVYYIKPTELFFVIFLLTSPFFSKAWFLFTL